MSTLRLRSAELAVAGAPQVAIDAFERRGVEQVRHLDVAGGEARVGTDVGYMTAFDPHQTSRAAPIFTVEPSFRYRFPA